MFVLNILRWLRGYVGFEAQGRVPGTLFKPDAA